MTFNKQQAKFNSKSVKSESKKAVNFRKKSF